MANRTDPTAATVHGTNPQVRTPLLDLFIRLVSSESNPSLTAFECIHTAPFMHSRAFGQSHSSCASP